MKWLNRGFNKSPGEIGEEIFKQTHKKIEFRDEKKELNDYCQKRANDSSKVISNMTRMNTLNNLRKFK